MSKIIKPICPYCNEEMSVVKFTGYYDSFTYWECKCEENMLEEHIEDVWYSDH